MKTLISDALWERKEPLLAPLPPRRFDHPGRKPLDRRAVLTGILFVLKPASLGTTSPPNSAGAAAKRVAPV